MSTLPNILQAISDLGGINPQKIKDCGTWAEWKDLPGKVRSRIFRHSSHRPPDEMAEQLESFGITCVNDLLEYLKDPYKLQLREDEASEYDQLVSELGAVQQERDALKTQVEILSQKLAAYERMNPYELLAGSGGRARASKLTPERRREIAQNAAKARYSKIAIKEVA